MCSLMHSDIRVQRHHPGRVLRVNSENFWEWIEVRSWWLWCSTNLSLTSLPSRMKEVQHLITQIILWCILRNIFLSVTGGGAQSILLTDCYTRIFTEGERSSQQEMILHWHWQVVSMNILGNMTMRAVASKSSFTNAIYTHFLEIISSSEQISLVAFFDEKVSPTSPPEIQMCWLWQQEFARKICWNYSIVTSSRIRESCC
jgi:hypothetical protein